MGSSTTSTPSTSDGATPRRSRKAAPRSSEARPSSDVSLSSGKQGRLRLLRLELKPVLVWDDGDTLEPVQSNVLSIGEADLDNFPAMLREDIIRVERELRTQ